MRIIECNIDKFGVISNQKFTFSANLNCIVAENGTGKTTLCAFIKAMLYGIGDTKRVSLDENDRKRYLPWSGGKAQGSMTFFANGRTYRVERSFGAKASEDTFALYDVERGSISTDFTEQLGCELFGIDRDGYEETVYLSEKGLSPSGQNKSVSAKLSDLVGADGDIGVMDDALKILENQRKFLQKKGSVGAISDVKLAIKEKMKELDALSEAQEISRRLAARRAEIAKELEQIHKERDALMKMQADSAKLELYQGFEEKCKALLVEIEKAAKEKDEIIQRLGGNIPEREFIDTLRLEYLEAQKLLSRQSEQNEGTSELDELSAIFGTQDADTDMAALTAALADVRELSRMRGGAEYAEIKSAFSRRTPTAAECDEAIASLTAPKAKSGILGILSLVFAILALPSIILGVVFTPAFYALAIGTAVLAVSLSLVKTLKLRGEERARTSAARGFIKSVSGGANPEEGMLAYLVRLRSLVERAEELDGARWHSANEVISRIQTKYSKSTDEQSVEGLIKDYERYKLLSARAKFVKEGAEDNRKLAEERILGVRAEFKKLGLEFNNSFTEIYTLIDRYRELSREITSKREEYARYKTEDMLDKREHAELASGEEIKEKLVALDERAREISSEGGSIDTRLAELSRRLDERESIESERGALTELLEKYETNLSVILKTRELMTLAKDNMQSKYLGKTQRAFAEYTEKISGDEGAEYRLDTDFNITKSEGGISRASEAYSRGTRELYNLAIRLALIDSLYEGERPFIILDDPFAYLDDGRLGGAKAVISRLGDNKQIIYLTCVKSRCINGT